MSPSLLLPKTQYFSLIATNIAVAVSNHVPKNNGCSKSNTNLLECSAENEDDDASNVSLATSNERPVSLELQPTLPAHGSAQVSVPHSTEHTM